jgi:CRP/FNR family transcriptional regulator, nitrogen oxide reductase regulator
MSKPPRHELRTVPRSCVRSTISSHDAGRHSRAAAPLDFGRRIAAIESAPLFRGASEAEKSQLGMCAQERRVPRKEFFFQEGEPAAEALLLCSGRVKLTQLAADGQEFISRLAGPGEQFESLGLATGGTHCSTAEALEACVALVWDRHHFEGVIEGSATLQRNALRIVAQRLRNSEQHARELATERVPQRLSRTLSRLVGQIGRPVEGSVLVALTREEFAQMTGTTLFTVSRIFSAWESEGVIRPRREGVLVDDPVGLVRIAESEPVARRQSAN